MEALKEKAALKDVTDLSECADMYVAIAKNTSMTGQKIAVGKTITYFTTSPQLTISRRRWSECCLHVSGRGGKRRWLSEGSSDNNSGGGQSCWTIAGFRM